MKQSTGQERSTWFWVAVVVIMLLLPVLGAWLSNVGILVLLFWVGFCTLCEAKGWAWGGSSERGVPWGKEKIVRRCSYIFTPFAGALITANVGSNIFGSAWSSWGLRFAFILVGEIAAVLLVRWKGPVIARKPDDAENRFREAERCSDPSEKEFDLDRAIRLLKEALMLKPKKEQYRKKLDEIREIKAKTFVMQVTGPAMAVKFATGAKGMVIRGRVYHGTIQSGDEVQIRGPGGTIIAKVFDIPNGLGVPSKEVSLALEGVTKTGDVSVGDVVEKV